MNLRQPWTIGEERVAMRMRADGAFSAEIGAELGRSERGVRDHLRFLAMSEEKREGRRDIARRWRARKAKERKIGAAAT